MAVLPPVPPAQCAPGRRAASAHAAGHEFNETLPGPEWRVPVHWRIGSYDCRASWPMTAIAVLGVVVFGLLGRWQWHRASEKRLQLAAFATAGSMPVQPLGARTPAALPRFAAVAVSGQYDGDHQFLLDNISRGSRAGFEVLTPMWLADGRTVLINRGWLPLRDGSRAQLPDVSLPGTAQTMTLFARVDELPVAGIASGKAPPPASGPWPKLTS